MTAEEFYDFSFWKVKVTGYLIHCLITMNCIEGFEVYFPILFFTISVLIRAVSISTIWFWYNNLVIDTSGVIFLRFCQNSNQYIEVLLEHNLIILGCVVYYISSIAMSKVEHKSDWTYKISSCKWAMGCLVENWLCNTCLKHQRIIIFVCHLDVRFSMLWDLLSCSITYSVVNYSEVGVWGLWGVLVHWLLGDLNEILWQVIFKLI